MIDADDFLGWLLTIFRIDGWDRFISRRLLFLASAFVDVFDKTISLHSENLTAVAVKMSIFGTVTEKAAGYNARTCIRK